MRWIYLSPHLDDAVFSAGGLIYEQVHEGIPVEIWTIMAGCPPQPEDVSPYAQVLHMEWGFSSAAETARGRRAEDTKAAAILGAKPVRFDFLDCIYRRGANGEWLYLDVFVPPHAEEAELPAQIAEAISARLQSDDILVCQLSIGSHVDHVLVRQAVELLRYPVRYDIDVPYIFYHPQELAPKSAGMQESVYSITEAGGVYQWKNAAAEYKSQFVGLGEAFDTPEKAQASIQSYWAERQGIRLLHIA
jgi:LmbE family N-acetylglucosaminyl deacetylase